MALDSCHLDTDALTTVDTLERNIPDIVITNVVYKEKEDNQLTQEVSADEFRVFMRENLIQVDNGQVKTYSGGKEQLFGKAVGAEYNQKTEDASVTGPIEVYYYPEKTRVLAQQLNWTNKDQSLVSPPEEVVEVEQDNGTKFQGRNFSVDMRTRTVTYGKDVTGKLYAVAEGEKLPEDNLTSGEVAVEQAPELTGALVSEQGSGQDSATGLK